MASIVEVGLEPQLVWLDDPKARDAALVGSKAAALAQARAAGLPVLDGFVITTNAAARIGAPVPDVVRAAWRELSVEGSLSLVVRSSSALEDTATSSMAGQFATVVGVNGSAEFEAALTTVASSAEAVATTKRIPVSEVPIAILVQRLIVPDVGGVMFGIEPVTGRTDRRVIAAVRGLPEALVSGVTTGSRYEVDRRGRRRNVDPGGDMVPISRRIRRRLVRLADRCAEIFGGPQDIEWAVDADGGLWLLQSRPVTTTVAGVAEGPVLGPGPTAETFPDPLTPLEQDLWAVPLRRAIGSVFEVLGVTSRRRRRRSPLLVVVGGRVAVDLDLFEAAERASWYAVARRARALRAAWRLGRLGAALPALGEDIVEQADEALLAVARPDTLTDRQLVAALGRFQEALASLHGYEMLVGLVLRPEDVTLTASSVALRVLARGREEGIADVDLPLRYPIVLALAPPRIGPDVELPRRISLPEWTPGTESRAGLVREALRVRVRWVQEASARCAWEIGVRLTDSGSLDRPEQVRDLDLESLEMTVRGLAVTVHEQLGRTVPRAEPLPARFRLSDRGIPIPVLDRHPHQGAGAGGGRAAGRVHIGAEDVPDGAVLVVRTLDAGLAPLLGRINGLVAETGSVLAHLSILAREAGVPTVVGLEDATERFSEGTLVSVDGMTGTVTGLDDDGSRAVGEVAP